MNRENLKKMADYIATVPQEHFDMETYRHGDDEKHECDSVGCVIGHCTILEKDQLPRFNWGGIIYDDWSEKFTGLNCDSKHWRWCFGAAWKDVEIFVIPAVQ